MPRTASACICLLSEAVRMPECQGCHDKHAKVLESVQDGWRPVHRCGCRQGRGCENG